MAPVEDGEGVGIGGGIFVAEHIGLLRQLAIEPAKADAKPLNDHLAAFFWHRLVEQSAKTLVQLGGDEVQGFHGPVTLHCAGLGEKIGSPRLVDEILQNGRNFGQYFAFAEIECRHITLGIDLHVVSAAFGFFRAKVDFFYRVGAAQLIQNDVGSQ